MIGRIKQIVKKILPGFKVESPKDKFAALYEKSYSQSGEDLIINFIFSFIGIENVSYLDIGANEPIKYNNTYKFHKICKNGVLVEPNPLLKSELQKFRPNDKLLEIGLGDKEISSVQFYILKPHTLSTFDEKTAEKYINEEGAELIETKEIKITTLDNLIETEFGKAPSFISIDAEGYDFKILKGLKIKKFFPKVFCIETLTYSKNGDQFKRNDIIDYVKKMGYYNYADTYINTIFVRNDLIGK